ncbi:MAG: AsmA family protein, partial [Thauera sp.]
MTDTTTDSTSAPPRRKGTRRALWTAGTLLALSAVAYLVTPPVARHYAQLHLGELLGRQVSIERVLINPFRLTAEVGGLRVMEADGSGEALAFDALRANLELESIVRKGVVLHELALEAPRVKLALDEGGRHNWSDVVERLQAMGGYATAEDAAPLPFSVGNIRISNGQVEVEDKPRGLTHTLSEIGLGVPFVSNLPVRVDVFVQPSLSAKLNGDPLLLNARTKPFAETHETILDVALNQFDLAPWVAYLPLEPRFKLPSALLTTNLELSFSQPPEGAPVVALRGPLQVDQLVLQDREGAPAAAIAELELEFADVQPLIGRWHFTRLRLAKPEVDLVMGKDGRLNVLDLLPPPAAPASAKPSAATAPAGAADAGAAAAPDAAQAEAAAKPAAPGAEPAAA